MSKIEWTDETWNPVTGCSKHSPGCDNCYAERMHKRLRGMGAKGYEAPFETVVCHPDRLDIPLKWREPRMVFVNSMSDLFHPNIATLFAYDVFKVMAECQEHIFQILTKRPDAMSEFCKRIRFITASELPHLNDFLRPYGVSISHNGPTEKPKPLPNVWLGVSVESASYTKRIDILRDVPAAVRFISFEPLIGRIGKVNLDGIHWVIVGCESGHGGRPKRPMETEWVREIRDQCVESGVAFFLKQMAIDNRVVGHPKLDGREWTEYPEVKDD